MWIPGKLWIKGGKGYVALGGKEHEVKEF